MIHFLNNKIPTQGKIKKEKQGEGEKAHNVEKNNNLNPFIWSLVIDLCTIKTLHHQNLTLHKPGPAWVRFPSACHSSLCMALSKHHPQEHPFKALINTSKKSL